ncbi:MAG: hypothetical protein AAGF86_12215, partial [Pseudomonadota bacterium]
QTEIQSPQFLLAPAQAPFQPKTPECSQSAGLLNQMNPPAKQPCAETLTHPAGLPIPVNPEPAKLPEHCSVTPTSEPSRTLQDRDCDEFCPLSPANSSSPHKVHSFNNM